MTERYDFVAFNDRGAYAICEDDGSAEAQRFVLNARYNGDVVERLPVAEACQKHHAYLEATWPAYAEMVARYRSQSKPTAAGVPVRGER